VGSYTFRFTAPSLTQVDAAAATTLSAGPAAKLALTTQPPTAAQSGVGLSTQPVVQLQDESGNSVAQAGTVVTATTVSGTGTMSNATATTNASGVGSFGTLALSGTVGSYTFRFTAPSLTQVDAAAATTLSAGPAAKLALTTQPSASAYSGVPLGQQPVVQVQDGAGNNVNEAGIEVTASIASGAGTLGGTRSVSTSASGQAAFNNLQITGLGAYALSFTSASLTAATSYWINVDVPAPQLAFRGASEVPDPMGTWLVRYRLTVTNRSAYPQDLFDPRRDFAPCGENEPNQIPSRVFVVIQLEGGTTVSDFRCLSGPEDLDSLWFDYPLEYSPPRVYIDMWDSQRSAVYTSNVVSLSAPCTLNSPEDSDGDRLPDCVETNTGTFVNALNTGTAPSNPDTDDDGIPDGDEVLGTVQGLDLPSMGSSPLRKDILIEYDWFDDALDCGSHSHRPTATAVAMVAQAFARAPVLNPDGSTGINLINDYGQGGVFTGGNRLSDADGVLAGGVSDAEFQAYKGTNFDAKRLGYFHYTILPHRYNTNSASSGQAEIQGDDMIVSLYCAGSDRNVAHTVMHELGHNLNLRHGGFENTNYKPNYNSVMNYKYQFPGIDNNCTPPGDGVLDYSLGVRPALNENNLDETRGLCGNPPGPAWDWNGDGDADDVGISADVNVAGDGTGDGVLEVLRDHDDWAFLTLSGLARAAGVAVVVREVVDCTNPAPLGRR
jgi:hypothetical protein